MPVSRTNGLLHICECCMRDARYVMMKTQCAEPRTVPCSTTELHGYEEQKLQANSPQRQQKDVLAHKQGLFLLSLLTFILIRKHPAQFSAEKDEALAESQHLITWIHLSYSRQPNLTNLAWPGLVLLPHLILKSYKSIAPACVLVESRKAEQSKNMS